MSGLEEGRASTGFRAELGESRSVDTWEFANDYEQLFLLSRDLMCVAGLDDGYFKRLNPAWSARLGWGVEELMARPFIDFVHRDDRQRTINQVSELASGTEAILFENRYRHRDGTYLWLRWNARPVPERQRIYAIARDVTTQKRFEQETIEILDRERERLGREMHDGLCQALAGIAALSAAHSKKLSDKAESTAASEITELLLESIHEAHNIAVDLGPDYLTKDRIDESLHNLARITEYQFGIGCTFECVGPVCLLEPDVKLHLVRIAQQAVGNAVAHARAGQIKISLRCNEEFCRLTVQDDGAGLLEIPNEASGMGMQTMKHRAQLIGASLEVRRRARRGTLVGCTLPLRKTPHRHDCAEHATSNTL